MHLLRHKHSIDFMEAGDGIAKTLFICADSGELRIPGA